MKTLSIADLYDSSKAEVLGQIKTSSVADYANKNWANGHYLVVQWETPLPSHVIATPYGDYYDPATNTDADSTIQVWETFVNHMVSRHKFPVTKSSRHKITNFHAVVLETL